MTCRLPVPRWWQQYVLGAFKTPQALYEASRAENPDPAKASDRFHETPEDGPLWDVPERLRAPQFISLSGYMSQQERADWRHVDPRLRYWAAKLVIAARKRGIPLYVHCALRDKAEQDRAFQRGYSKARYPLSAHNIGEAVDIVHGLYHWEMTKQEWQFLHVLGQLTLDRVNATLKKADKLELTWGGDFKSLWDPAHWEITDFRTRRRDLPQAPPLHLTPDAIVNQGLSLS